MAIFKSYFDIGKGKLFMTITPKTQDFPSEKRARWSTVPGAAWDEMAGFVSCWPGISMYISGARPI